jgi:CRISPR-associated protein Csh1
VIEAVRTLGILKMIDQFKEFNSGALKSVDLYLDQRKKAIENGVYAQLQFESIQDEQIGIFAIDGEKMVFKIESVADDNWKYLFLKTPPKGTYITPTWKEALSDPKKPKPKKSKLKTTIESTVKRSKEDNADWLQNLVKIYTSNEVEIGELDKDGNLEKKSFLDTVRWANDVKKVKIFSVKINGKYNSEINEILDLALANKPRINYQTEKAKSFNLPGIKCSLCNKEGELFPNVLSRDGVGINIGNVDKPGFFPGVESENAGKAFPICAPCAEALYVAKFHVFPNLIQSISGHRALIIPHLIESDDKKEGLKIVTSDLNLIRSDVRSAEQTEKNILKDLSENKSVATITFLIGKVDGQSVQNIRKVIPHVLPSRLSKISNAIKYVNEINDTLPDEHPWKSKKYPPLDGNLRLFKNVLGDAKYSKQEFSQGRKPFKASSVDTLDILSAIFLRRKYPLKDLLAEFSSKLSYDFLGALSDDDKNKPIYSIQNNIRDMVYLLSFLEKIEVIKMNSGDNFVSKYLEGHEGLKPLNGFLSAEAKGLDTKDKQYAFLVGLLFGKLVSFQMARGVSTNALKWLRGLHLSPQDLTDICVKTRRKLDDYSTPKSAWSDEMKGVSEAIAALGADISNWDISRKEIPYYLCLGQSLSGYYLPSKSNANQTDEKKGGI